MFSDHVGRFSELLTMRDAGFPFHTNQYPFSLVCLLIRVFFCWFYSDPAERACTSLFCIKIARDIAVAVETSKWEYKPLRTEFWYRYFLHSFGPSQNDFFYRNMSNRPVPVYS